MLNSVGNTSTRSFTTSPNKLDTHSDGQKQPIEQPHKTFNFPGCWEDTERMQVLMAPFRERSVNEASYDAKMKFWQNLISEYCAHKGEPHFTKSELQTAFLRGDQIPHCLDDVIADMQRTKQTRSRIDFEYDPLNSWSGWMVNSFVKRPIAKLRSSVALGEHKQAEQHVLLELMKRFCHELYTKVLQPLRGRLLHYDAIEEITRDELRLTEDCLRLCLHTLSCQHRIGLDYRQENKRRCIHLIKIPAKNDDSVEITTSDYAQHNLRMTESGLLKQLESLETEIKNVEQRARQLLLEDKRNMAKVYLRKKHLIQKHHDKRSLALHNIEMLLASVDEAQSNGEILDAYKIGSNALQELLSSSGLQYDNVDEVIFDMKSTLEAHQEVQDTLANTSVSETLNTTDYDDDELERELCEILGESKAVNSVSDPSSSPTVVDISQAAGDAAPPQAAGNAKPSQATITDKDLLEMLDQLDVEDRLTPTSLQE